MNDLALLVITACVTGLSLSPEFSMREMAKPQSWPFLLLPILSGNPGMHQHIMTAASWVLLAGGLLPAERAAIDRVKGTGPGVVDGGDYLWQVFLDDG
jgi:hypothetical protein